MLNIPFQTIPKSHHPDTPPQMGILLSNDTRVKPEIKLSLKVTQNPSSECSVSPCSPDHILSEFLKAPSSSNSPYFHGSILSNGFLCGRWQSCLTSVQNVETTVYGKRRIFIECFLTWLKTRVNQMVETHAYLL